MIIVMHETANEAQISNVIARLTDLHFDIHRSTGVRRTVIGAIGDIPVETRELEILDGVEEVRRITVPYKLASRSFNPEGTRIGIKNVTIGGPEVVMIAGPCAVESLDQMTEIAEVVAAQGATILRGGAFKPRTSPYSFQGLGEEGLKYLRMAGERYGLPVISEVMECSQVPMAVDYLDILQVGARNMQNFNLLAMMGKARTPVLLKRSAGATVEEALLAAEYIMSGGNHEVILCERGIRTFETSLRNTFDISAIPVIKSLSHLPIIADPSHASGRRDKVVALAQAAVAAGADGLLVEVHNDPDNALCDGPQSLYPEQFERMMGRLVLVANAIGKTMALPGIRKDCASSLVPAQAGLQMSRSAPLAVITERNG